MAGYVKAMYAAQWGMMTMTLHLHQANPHMDAFDQPFSFATEAIPYRMSSMFHGVMSRGFGGSNVYLLNWGRVDEEKVAPVPVVSYAAEEALQFWPGGGGQLESDMVPEQCYTVVGTWTKWEVAEPMMAEEKGVYALTMTMGRRRSVGSIQKSAAAKRASETG